MNKQKIFPLSIPVLAGLLAAALWLWPGSRAGAVSPSGAEPPADPWAQFVQRQDSPPGNGNAPQAALSLNFNLYEYRAAGHVPLPAPVVITLTRNGNPVYWQTVYPVPDAQGYFYLSDPLCGTYGCHFLPESGDRVQVRQGTSALSLTLPTLKVWPNASRDVLTGTAPASATLTAYRFPFDDETAVYTATTNADVSGAYTLPLADLRPRDGGYLIYEVDASRRVYQPYRAPFLRVQAESTYVSGQVLPRQSVYMNYDTPLGPVMLFAQGDHNGDFAFLAYGWEFFKNSPPPSNQPGDVVKAAAEGNFGERTPVSTTVHTIRVWSDAARNRVFGEADPGAQVTILVYRGPLESHTDPWERPVAARQTVTANATGAFSATLPLTPGDYGIATVPNGDGHETLDWFATSYAAFRLGYHDWAAHTAVRGQVDSAGLLTVTVQGPSGYLKSAYNTTADWNGYFPASTVEYDWRPDYGFVGFALESGDRVTITQNGAPVISMTMPALTLRANYEAEALEGEAPPNANLTLSWHQWTEDWLVQQVTMTVTASPSGTYQVPFSEMNINSRERYIYPTITWISPAGYAVRRSIQTELYSCMPSFPQITVGGNEIWWKPPSGCDDNLTVQLLDAQGSLKAEKTVSPSDGGIWFQDADKSPIPINGGDTLVFTAGEERSEIAIPPLGVTLDPEAGHILIQAEPERRLNFDFSGDLYVHTVITTNAQGAYTYTLPAGISLNAGDFANVYYGHLVQFFALNRLPQVQVALYESKIHGYSAPVQPFTVTYRTPQGESGQLSGHADSNGVWQADFDDYESTPGDVVTLTLPSGVYTLTVPTLSAALNPRTAAVSGEAPDGAEIAVTLATRYWTLAQTVPVSGGTYIASFPQFAYLADLHGNIEYATPRGDTVQLDFAAPHWEVTIGQRSVKGYASLPGDRVAYAHHSQNGAVFTGTLTSNASNGSFYIYPPQEIAPGDRLVMTDTQGMRVFTIPQVTANHNYASQTLTGIAPPGSRVDVDFGITQGPWEVYGGYLHIIRRVYADEQGNYGMDTSDLSLSPGDTGHILAWDADGNRIRVDFTIQGYQTWMPVISR